MRILKNIVQHVRPWPWEALIWTAGLVVFACLSPGQLTFTICPFHYLGEYIGVDFCPGCGLGQAIILLFDGDLRGSWAAHPFGGLAVVILMTRIFTILKYHIRYGQSNRRAA